MRLSDSPLFDEIYRSAHSVWVAAEGFTHGVGIAGDASVPSGAEIGVTVGRLMASSSEMVLSLLSGPFTITSEGDLKLNGPTGAPGSTLTARIKAEQAAPYLSITQDLSVSVVVAALGALSLSASSYVTNALPGATVATIGGKTAGSTLTISPDDGRLVLNAEQTAVLVGPATSTPGLVLYTITETLAGVANSPRGNGFQIEVIASVEAPSIEIPPAISGDVTEGSVLTAVSGVYSGGGISITGQWYVGETPIVGETSLLFTRTFGTVGAGTVTYRETAANSEGSIVAASNALAGTTAGLLGRIAMRGDVAAIGSRWTCLTPADNGGAEITRLPDGNNPVGYAGYTFKSGNGSNTTTINSGETYAQYLRGVQTMSGAGAYVAVKVPVGVPVKVRCALGALTNGTTATNQGVRIDDDGATPQVFANISNQTQSLNNILQFDGTQIAHADWLSQGKWLTITSQTGWVAFRKPTVGICSLRAIEVAYPSFGIVTAGVGPFFVDNVEGDDLTGDGSELKPWKSIPGDPNADGVLSVFSVLPGGQGVKLKATGVPYTLDRPLAKNGVFGTLTTPVAAGATMFTIPAAARFAGQWLYLTDGSGTVTEAAKVSSDGSGNCVAAAPLKFAHPAGSAAYFYRETYVSLPRDGLPGSPIKFSSYGAGRAVLDGGEKVAGWTAVSNAEVGNNPNAANIQKAVIARMALSHGQTIHEGIKCLYPAQFPEPSEAGSFNMPYVGSDAFVELTRAEYLASVTQAADNSGGAGFRLCTFTSSVLAGRYGPNNVSLVGWPFVCRMDGNRLGEWIVTAHTPSTGAIAFLIPNDEELHEPSTSVGTANFVWCVRGHPFDIRQQGQYAYSADLKTVFGWFAGAADRTISRIEYAVTFTKNYVEFDNIDFRGFGVDYGGVARDDASPHVGGKITNTRWWACSNNSGNGIFRPAAGTPLAPDAGTFELENVDGWDTSRVGLMQMSMDEGHIKGIRHRDAGRTSVYFGGNSHHNIVEDFDFSDNSSIHGNGGSNYQKTNHNQFIQGYGMNHMLPYTAQTSDRTVLKANRVKNTVLSNRLAYLGTTNETYGVPGPIDQSGFVMQVLDAETESEFEGVIAVINTALLSGSFALDHPTNPGAASTGQVIRNCIFSKVAAVQMKDRILQNVLILREGGQGIGPGDIADIDPASFRVEFGDGEEQWEGTITQQMQKVLTRNGDTETYLPRTLGPISGPGANPWYVPAWGEAHSLPNAALTTTSIRRGFRKLTPFASLVSTGPGATVTLPVGQGDNALFGHRRGTIHWMNAPTPGTYTVVVRQTSNHPDLIGGGTQTKDTTITITVI